YSNFTGVILAGGENRRYGGKLKTSIIIDGKTIIERTTGIFNQLFDSVVIVTNQPEYYAEYRGCTITSDIFRGAGPLGGLHAAMTAADTEVLMMVAGDMPYVSAALIDQLIGSWDELACDALIPLHNGHMEPLFALYSVSLKERLEEFLTLGSSFAIRDFLKLVETEYFEIDITEYKRNPFANINSPDDLARLTGEADENGR
ncbi:MAG: molybdenum cofactor guanylyltransferase, partial [Bacteroidales bacterium]|nr:molybdenum cofactor guanylyltransferase [Bacteroidales bacterium]